MGTNSVILFICFMDTSGVLIEAQSFINKATRWREVKRKVPVFGRMKTHYVGYLATTVFEMRHRDMKKRFHVFINKAAKLYPPPSV